MGISIEEARRVGIPEEYLREPERPRAFTGPAPGRRSKYHNRRTPYNGVTYASKAEASRAYALDAALGLRMIRGWIGQPKFRLGLPENIYVADFLVFDRDGTAWVEDVKGVRTAKFERDVKLWRRYGPCPLRILRNGKVSETITPNPANGGDIT
jgi:hypothetical protein